MANAAVRIIYFADSERDALSEQARLYLGRCQQRFDADALMLKPAKRKKKADDNQIKSDEAERLLNAAQGRTLVALDGTGPVMSSEKFAKQLERWLSVRRVALCIGGASGLHSQVRDRADALLSLGAMTLPHRLALLVCAEQVFRAHEILRGGPYHKQ